MEFSELNDWVAKMAAHCGAEAVHWCDGSQGEYDAICQGLVDEGVFVPLEKRPGSYWCASDPGDVARVEERTFICSEKKEDAGPTNHWVDPAEMRKTLDGLFSGCMKGRTLYVIPFSMGPVGSSLSLIGVQLTDSPYVVANMRIMTRMGKEVLETLEKGGRFVPCVHSVGVPLQAGEKGPRWPYRPDDKYIVHFPESREIWSFGSGYGGNALLGKKCLALRIASAQARDEGWLAEHMVIIRVKNPEGKVKYFTAAFPSACGKTNLAMLESTLPGWEIKCVGDDIAWMRIKEDGKLWAINPEYGFFGVAPGTSMQSNPNAMRTVEKNAIFTNVALTRDGDVWWEGMSESPPPIKWDWKRNENWDPKGDAPSSHPNARFTVPAEQCPVIDAALDDPNGVPIEAMIFGGRRKKLTPLVLEARSWQHGVFMGASISSEMTAAAAGKIGQLRHDPFAMLPFCGYHMGDYFAHWIDVGTKLKHHPRIYNVNWFRQGIDGEYSWPGFGENMRVIKWIFERCDGVVDADDSPLGYRPRSGALGLSDADRVALFDVDPASLKQEIEEISEYFKIFGEHLPKELLDEIEQLKERAQCAS